MKPNIVFIMADDMGYGDLGCYGAHRIETPNIDGLADMGMRFTDLHASSAVCTPSRYSVLTGRYCWRSRLKRGVLGGFGSPIVEDGRMTVASMLKNCGYATGAVGKWHLGLDWTRKDGSTISDSELVAWELDGFDVDYNKPLTRGPTDRGFDFFFGISGSLDMPPYCFIENDRTVGIPSLEKRPYEAQQRKGLMVPDWRDDLVDVTFAEQACRFMRDHVRSTPEKPFFLYLTPSAPHRPCVPPEFMRGKSRAGLRGDMVVLIDWVVGQVVDSLKSLGILDNTVILVTSDNGARLTNFDGRDHGHRANGDLRGQKADIFEGGHREPFVAAWSGVIPPASVCAETACLTDILSTCAEIAGTGLPAEAGEDSVSLVPLFRGEKPQPPLREALVHHSFDGMFSVRKGPWKLVDGLGSGGFSEPARYEPTAGGPFGQLYHLVNDSRETANLWSKNTAVVEELLDVLRNQA